MAARAIWKGRLSIGKLQVAVRMYSAVQDQAVHFRLLDKRSLSPVRQRIVRKSDGEPVERKDQHKAYELDSQQAVMLKPEELESLEPQPSREVELCRFVAPSLVGDPWYDRPYWLGPDGDDKSYFALAGAMAERKVLGIARWVMRKKRYVGALALLEGYLMMVTLRRSDQVLALPAVEPRGEPDARELKLAGRLIEEVSGDFDPALWQDEYHERVRRLIEAKAKGRKIEAKPPKRRRAGGDLAGQLRRSLSSMKERKVA